MQEWERKFDEVALDKGQRLFKDGKVENIQKGEKRITAFLSGVHRYAVSMILRSDKPIRMKCQCPKAKGGSNCEHMAAVLYAVYGGCQDDSVESTGKQDEKKQASKEEAEKIRAEKEAREEAARRIAVRNAEKAAKKAERMRRKLEAEKAAKQAAAELELKRGQEEKERQKEVQMKAAEEAARKKEEEAARIRLEEERARKKEEKIQAAIKRKEKGIKAGEEPDAEDSYIGKPERLERDENDYNYFDLVKIRKTMEFSKKTEEEGMALFRNGQVQIESFLTGFIEDDGDMVAEVRAIGKEGREDFHMRLLLSRTRALHSECECPQCRRSYYWYAGRKGCAYLSGMLYEIESYLRYHSPGDATDKRGMDILNLFQVRHALQVVAEDTAQDDSQNLVPRLIYQNGRLSLSFRVGSSKLYVIKDLFEFNEQVQNSETAIYGTNTRMNHKLSNFTARGQEWAGYIHRIVEEELEMERRLCESGWYYGKQTNRHNVIDLSGWKLDEFYQLLGSEKVEYEDRSAAKKEKRMICCKEATPRISMEIRKNTMETQKEFHGVQITCEMPVFFKGVEASYFVEKDCLCRTGQEYMERIRLLADQSRNGLLSFKVGRNNLSEFYYMVLPRLRDVVDVTEADTDEIHEYLPPEVQFMFYLDARDHNISCRLHAKYGEHEVSVFDLLDENQDRPLERFRMENKEAEILLITRRLFPEIDVEEDELHCGHDEDLMYSMLEHGVETLLEYGEVQCTQRFRNMNVLRKVKVSVGVSISSGLLNLDITTEDIPREELLDVLKSYRSRKKFYRLKSGDFLKLEDNTLEMLGELMDSMHLSPKDFVKGKMHLPVYRTLYLDKLLEENENIYSSRDSHFREIVKNFKTINEADYEEPASLSGIMRGYQKKGYRWLRTLETCGFGGILADDMGLGKTLQAIAVLLAAKEEGRTGATLIVCPASLVFNWGEELERFAPQLKVLLITGSQEERRQKLDEYTSYDVLVTSYDLLKRDIVSYEDKEFLYEIIDEAQYIKNHTTAASKAVKVIKSQFRYAMTGTPIENRLSELWSIFDYLMPGFLYSYEIFKREIETPIVKNGDEDAMKRLQKMTGAFILRRLKSDVLKDLPDKLEEIRYVKMEKPQQKIYDAQVVHMQTQLAEQDDAQFHKNKIQILAELMKLRQICCDPGLCFEDYRNESAKLESCLELIQSAIDGGHKLLLFSQFTTMLEIIKQRLAKLGIGFYVITGETAKEKRLQMVKAFNEDSTPVFLISLKAGGVGLNLTGADVVIHYDPWWNLAVQNQATDRAHRIGQTKKVTVYKLIVKHTIEEKIQKLQEAKMDLADQIVNAQTGGLGGMSQAELLELLEA